MAPEPFYRTALDSHTLRLHTTGRTRNWITTLKLLCFAGIVYALYRGIAEGSEAWFGGVGGLILLFTVLNVWDSRVAARIAELRTLMRCCQTELDYLQGNYSELATGAEHLDPAHPYALDLDLFGEDSLFQTLNRTVTPDGTARLVGWMLTPGRNADELRERQQAAAELAETPARCLGFRSTGLLHTIRNEEGGVITRWLAEAPFFSQPKSTRQLLYASNGLSAALWMAACCGVISFSVAGGWFALQLALLGILLKRINRLSHQLDRFSRAITAYYRIVGQLSSENFSAPELVRLQTALGGEHPAAKAFGKPNRILNGFDQRNNVLIGIGLNGLYLKDLHHILQLDEWRNAHREQVARWLDAVGRFDALVSLATYRFNHPEFCTPELSSGTLLDAQGLGHPLIDARQRICNDLRVAREHDLYIVTGANMAGKSTFLRTVGVNLVLALAGSVVCSERFTVRPMALFTSMRTTDNLARGTSYFHAELLRLRQLVETAQREAPLFVILDEMLKGTNSHDKLHGSLQFLTRLLSLPVSGLIATHDLALGELAEQHPDHFRNVCFEIEHSDETILYDYKLRPGISRNMNASILLRQMGLIG